MRIKLPWIEPFDTLALPDDFEDQVKQRSENDFCSYAERRTDVKADKGASR